MSIVYYISNSEGDDNNNGLSESSPYKTINKIEWSSRSGDYADVIFKFKRGDSWLSNNVNYFRGSDDNKKYVIFTDYGNGNLPIIPEISLTSNIKVKNLNFKANGYSGLGCLMLSQRSKVIIDNCKVQGEDGDVVGAIYLDKVNNVKIINSIITNKDDTNIAIDLLDSHNIIIENNYVKGWEEGINVYNPRESEYVKNIIIRGNDCIATKVGGGASIEVSWGGCSDIYIYNNKCRGNNYGLMLEGRNIHAYNNLLIDDEEYTFTDAIRFGGMKADWQEYNTNNYFSDMKIFNNTIVTNGRFFRIDGYNDLTNRLNPTFIYNNIFYSKNSDLHTHIEDYDAIKNSFIFQNNCFYTDNGTIKIKKVGGIDNLSWYDFKSTCNINNSNYYNDPMLNIEYKPLLSSICQNQGKRTHIDYDFAYNISKNNFIGCYNTEYNIISLKKISLSI